MLEQCWWKRRLFADNIVNSKTLVFCLSTSSRRLLTQFSTFCSGVVSACLLAHWTRQLQSTFVCLSCLVPGWAVSFVNTSF